MLPATSDQVLNRKVFFAVLVITLGTLGVGVAVDNLRLYLAGLMRCEHASPTIAGHTGKGPAFDDITDLVIGVLVAED